MANQKKRQTKNEQYGLKYPSPDKIASRTSTITRAMSSTLAPIVNISDDSALNKMAYYLYFKTKSDEQNIQVPDVTRAIKLGNNLKCVYCGGDANQLDHLFPLVSGKFPSGFITEPVNLVPCCGACNGSKGAKVWYDYMDIRNYITEEILKKRVNAYTKNGFKNVIKNITLKSGISPIFEYSPLDDLVTSLESQKENHNNRDQIPHNEVLKQVIKSSFENQKNLTANNIISAYLFYIKNAINLRDSKEKTLHRLIKEGGVTGLQERYNRLNYYCEEFGLPYINGDEKQEADNHKLPFVVNMDFKNWWNEMFDSIKIALEKTQIQLNAFSAGVIHGLSSPEKKFDIFIKEINERKEDDLLMRILNEMSEDKFRDIAKNAYERGFSYATNDENRTKLIELYGIKS